MQAVATAPLDVAELFDDGRVNEKEKVRLECRVLCRVTSRLLRGTGELVKSVKVTCIVRIVW